MPTFGTVSPPPWHPLPSSPVSFPLPGSGASFRHRLSSSLAPPSLSLCLLPIFRLWHLLLAPSPLLPGTVPWKGGDSAASTSISFPLFGSGAASTPISFPLSGSGASFRHRLSSSLAPSFLSLGLLPTFVNLGLLPTFRLRHLLLAPSLLLPGMVPEKEGDSAERSAEEWEGDETEERGEGRCQKRERRGRRGCRKGEERRRELRGGMRDGARKGEEKGGMRCRGRKEEKGGDGSWGDKGSLEKKKFFLIRGCTEHKGRCK